jgi:hypothetical protein
VSETPTVPVDRSLLHEVLGRRDELVRAITRGVADGEWDAVMEALDALLAALRQLDAVVGR